MKFLERLYGGPKQSAFTALDGDDRYTCYNMKTPDYLPWDDLRVRKILKSAGDEVREDEPIFIVASEIFEYEANSPVEGIIREIHVIKGSHVRPKDVLATIYVRAAPPKPEGVLPLESLGRLDPAEFENLMCNVCRAMGLEAEVTGKTGDGGIDIVAHNRSPLVGGTYIIQCKRYSGNVPVEMVRDLYGVVTDRRANKGILITSGGFTAAGYEFAKGKPLELIDATTLAILLRTHQLVSD